MAWYSITDCDVQKQAKVSVKIPHINFKVPQVGGGGGGGGECYTYHPE